MRLMHLLDHCPIPYEHFESSNLWKGVINAVRGLASMLVAHLCLLWVRRSTSLKEQWARSDRGKDLVVAEKTRLDKDDHIAEPVTVRPD